MEITFLGTGTSQGVPMIAHDAPELDLADRRNWRTRSSVHVVMGGWHIQVDAAQEFRLQCVQNDVRQVDTFLLTHAHADHVLGMDDLRRFCDLRGGDALDVYGNAPALERVRNVFPYAIRERSLYPGYAAFRLKEMPATLELPGGTVAATPLPHGQVTVLGFVFTEKETGKRLAYFTDCKEIPPAAEELARGCDLCVLDALRPQPHPTHMCVEEALAAAQRIGATQTYFTHLTFMINHATAQTDLPEGVAYAWDGLKVEV